MSQHSIEFDLFKDDLIDDHHDCMEDCIIEGGVNDRLNILKDYLCALQELKQQVQVFASSSQESQQSTHSNIQQLTTTIEKTRQFVTISKLINPKEYQLNKNNSFSDLMIKARVKIPLHQIIAKYQITIPMNRKDLFTSDLKILSFSDIQFEYIVNQEVIIEQIDVMDCTEEQVNISTIQEDKDKTTVIEEILEIDMVDANPIIPSPSSQSEIVQAEERNEIVEEKKEAFVDINCDCGICLLQLYDGSQIYNLETCNHAFHLTCVHRCMESRNIQKCCVKCFKEISFDERKQIKRLFKEDVRTKRIEKRVSNNPKPKETKKSKAKPKVQDPTFEPPSTPHKINHNLIIEEYGYMLNDHSELPLNYKCKSYLPSIKRSDKPVELICTITLNPNFGKDPHVFLLRIESSILPQALKSFSFEELTEMLKQQIEEKTSKRIENCKEYFGLKNKKVITIIEKIRDCEFFYRTAKEIRENSILVDSPIPIGKPPEIVVSETNTLKRKDPPKEPVLLEYVPVKKRKCDFAPILIERTNFNDVHLTFESLMDYSSIDMVISYIGTNYGIETTRSLLQGLIDYNLVENDCDVVSKLYILIQHSDISISKGISSLYDIFKQCDVKLSSIMDLYDGLSQSAKIIPNDIIYQYAKNSKEPSMTTISLINIVSKFLLPKYSESEIIKACTNIIDLSNTFFANLDGNISITSSCEHEILFGLYNVAKSIDYFIVDHMDCQTVLLNLITIIDHIERVGVDGIKECLIQGFNDENPQDEEMIDSAPKEEENISNSNGVIEMMDQNVNLMESQMKDDPPEQNQEETSAPSVLSESPKRSQKTTNSIPSFKISNEPLPLTQTSISIHSSSPIKEIEPTMNDLSSIAECSMEEKEIEKNISQQLSQLSSIQLSDPYPLTQPKIIVIPHSQESFPIEFSQQREEKFQQENISLPLSSFESEKVPSIFPYFD